MRRASTMTSAPSAPCARSCHMKPTRSWPGVPNRYSLRLSSMVMQPKSSATVVDVLAGTSPVRSIWAATEVIAASVVSGRISEIDDTVVVLPTPKPPAMTIFTGTGGRRRPGNGSDDGFKSTDDPLDQVPVVRREAGALDDDVPLRGEVGDEHPGHPDVQLQLRRHLGHRHRDRAELDDLAVLEGEPVARVDRLYLGLDLQRLVHRLGPPRGEQVRPQPGHRGVTGEVVVPGATDREVRPRVARRRLVAAFGVLGHRASGPQRAPELL